MFGDDHHYGHSDVLRRYCGLTRRPPIPALLQHGWQPGPGMAPATFDKPWPKLVWSRRNLDVCRERGFSHVTPIGAPFLYLPELQGDVVPSPRSLLVYPFHGLKTQEIVGDLETYAQQLERLVDAEGFGPVTVNMYWVEYERPALRSTFEKRGWSVTTNGAHNDNPEFLDRQRASILRHAYVTSNRVATATFYSLVLGRKFFLQGPPMGIDKVADPTGEVYDAWQRSEFPMLTWEGFGDATHREVGEAELGLEFKHSPSELREVLGWTPSGALRRARVYAQRLAWGARSFVLRR